MYFYFITAAFMIVAGILAAATLIVSKKPEAKVLIDKLTPYQGWVGIVLFFWGIWDIINSIGTLSFSAVFFLIYLVVALIELVLGFLLGFGLITKYALSKSEAALAKGQAIRAKLAPVQGIFGFIAIAMAIIFVILGFVFRA
jgi:succinate-acetate transporter protein